MLNDKDLFYVTKNPARVLKEFNLLREAIGGDLKFEITPSEVSTPTTSEAWTRTVTIKLVNSKGKVHDWYNGDISVSIADTSVAGTASISDETPAMTNGVCTVVISGDAQAWLADESDTLTVANLTVLGYTVTGVTSVETFTA